MKVSKTKLCILQSRLGMTGTQVAAKAGLKKQSYYAVKVRGSCATSTAVAIAAAFGVSVENITPDEQED